MLKDSSKSLKEYLNGQDLPFLFKILSVRTALSIQAHPDKELAISLHAADPKNYRDDNHKPEMAIALEPFEALCGFRPIEEISEFLKAIPALAQLVGFEAISSQAELKAAFTRLMNSSGAEVSSVIAHISHEFSLSNLFWRLNSQYPGDLGVLCVFFLNYAQLSAGEAVFLAANEPHAYLSGSCVECMATSDNVVRAGLTPKHRDVKTLCEMLTYQSFAGQKALLTQPKKQADGCWLYESPVREFSVLKLENEAKALPLEVGHSVLLCLTGTATLSTGHSEFQLKPGSIIYFPPRTHYSLSNAANFTAFQAFEPL